MTFDEFITQYDGKGIDFDGAYGFQCMDLAHRYAVDVVGVDIPAVPAAKDEWSKNISGYEKITNTPDGVPQKGDIVIWGTDIGAYGHIAIFIEGNASSFNSFDQNWPINSLCHKQPHSYKGVLGWFRPKTTTDTVIISKADFENLITKANQWDVVAEKQQVDKLDKEGGQKVVEAIDKLEKDVAYWHGEYDKLASQPTPTVPPETTQDPQPEIPIVSDPPQNDLPPIDKDGIILVIINFLLGLIFRKK